MGQKAVRSAKKRQENERQSLQPKKIITKRAESNRAPQHGRQKTLQLKNPDANAPELDTDMAEQTTQVQSLQLHSGCMLCGKHPRFTIINNL
jgi:hypothetical protein